MVERRKQPIRNQPNHGSNLRGARAMPRNPWEARQLQSEQDRLMLRERFIRKSRELQEERRTKRVTKEISLLDPLPADAHEQEIIDNIKKYRASSVTGPTGSGKSTRTPHFTRRADFDLTIGLVPRKIIAEGLHERLIDEMGLYLGADEAAQTVGIMHGDRQEIHDDDKVRVMTPNTFIRTEKALREARGDDSVVIIADEIHEANIYTEIALGVAAQSVAQNASWRLVAMSATHNAAALKQSFASLNNGEEAPTIAIEGRPFDLEVHERPAQSASDVFMEVKDDHERLMVFTSGKNEIDHLIEQMTARLEAEERGSSFKVEFRKLHGDLNRTMREFAKSPNPVGRNVVIVSTPVGMSGITIPGLTCVITDGTINRPELDEEAIPGMRRRYLSKAEVIQEMGRAGRDVAGGVGYLVKPTAIYEDELRDQGKLVAEEAMPYIPFDKRDEFGPAEIYNTNLGSVELSIAAAGYQFIDVNTFLPHPVEDSDILKTQEGLYRIGAEQPGEDGNLFVVSPIGEQMNEFPIRPELSRGLVEAQRNGRSLLQLARLALIVAAVDSGGLQNYGKEIGDDWREFLRSTTSDDMFAQYDLMTALPFTHEDDIDEKFVDKYDLNYKQVEQSLRVARKILKKLGIHRHGIVLTPPNLAEEEELRQDLTAGLIDNVYHKVGYYQKRQMYRNIHGSPGATERYISDRSIVSSHEHEYVAGMPRWFVKGRNQMVHDIIELAMPVDPAVVARYAMANGILSREVVGSTIVDNNAVIEQYQPKFGSILVGPPENGSFNEETPVQSQEALMQYVLTYQGRAQKALRSLAAELRVYTQRVPAAELKKRTKIDSGAFLTSEKIDQRIREAVKKTRYAFEVDRDLSLFIYQANIGIGRYFTEEAREELLAMSPGEFPLNNGSSYAKLQYDTPEVPYITMPQTDEGKALVRRTTMQLPDGREVLIKRTTDNGQAEFVSAKDI